VTYRNTQYQCLFGSVTWLLLLICCNPKPWEILLGLQQATCKVKSSPNLLVLGN